MKKILMIILLTLLIFTLTACKKDETSKNPLSLKEKTKSDLVNIDYVKASESTMKLYLSGNVTTTIQMADLTIDAHIEFVFDTYLNIQTFENAFLNMIGQVTISIPGMTLNLEIHVYYYQNLHIAVYMDSKLLFKAKTETPPLSYGEFIDLKKNIDDVGSFLENEGIVDLLMGNYDVGENGISDIFNANFNNQRLSSILEGESIDWTKFLFTEIKLPPIDIAGISINISDFGDLIPGSLLGDFVARASIFYKDTTLHKIKINFQSLPFQAEGLNVLPIKSNIDITFWVNAPSPISPDLSDYPVFIKQPIN